MVSGLSRYSTRRRVASGSGAFARSSLFRPRWPGGRMERMSTVCMAIEHPPSSYSTPIKLSLTIVRST